MGKTPATNGNMRNTLFDYPWAEVGKERGGPVPGIKEQLLAVDPETGAYTRIVWFQPGFKFDRPLQHPFWEELFMLEGHMIDYATNTLYTKGCYALRPAGVAHGPFGTDLGCTILETTWYDQEGYRKRDAQSCKEEQ
jgi:hypothetical protein